MPSEPKPIIADRLSTDLTPLVDIMEALRDPVSGCAWDRAQNFETIAPYCIEEAYEVVDAISRNDMDDLKSELGDLLLQVVFHSTLAKEKGHFTLEEVINAISGKLIRRHPHVFGNQGQRTAEEQNLAWEEQKAAERQAKKQTHLLADIPVGMPSLLRAVKLTKRAARVGFDWPDIGAVVQKLDEEVSELKLELESDDREAIAGELGDVLFVLANLARKMDLDPEECIRRTNSKFSHRFAYIEDQLLKQNRSVETSTLEEMDRLWTEAKRAYEGV